MGCIYVLALFMCLCVCMCMFMCLYRVCMCMCVCVHVCVCVCAPWLLVKTLWKRIFNDLPISIIHMYVCTYVCIHPYIYVCGVYLLLLWRTYCLLADDDAMCMCVCAPLNEQEEGEDAMMKFSAGGI